MKQMQLKCNLDLVQMQLDAPCIEQLSKVFNQVEVEAELGNYFKLSIKSKVVNVKWFK